VGIHHVNETASHQQWLWWEMAFLACGAIMLVVSWLLVRTGHDERARVERARLRLSANRIEG
jgi:uncharacterized membrane protein